MASRFTPAAGNCAFLFLCAFCFFALFVSLRFLSQTLALIPGTTYAVSLRLAVDSRDSVSGGPTPNDFRATFGGQTLFSRTNLPATDGSADPADDYSLYSFTAVAASASSTLQFGLLLALGLGAAKMRRRTISA